MNEEFIRKIQPIVDAINSQKIVDDDQAYEMDETETSAMSRLASLFASLVWECQSVYDLNANQGAVMVTAMNCVEQLANCLHNGGKLEINPDDNIIVTRGREGTNKGVAIKLYPGSRDRIDVVARGEGIDDYAYNSDADFHLYPDKLAGKVYGKNESPTFSIMFDANGLWRKSSISINCTSHIHEGTQSMLMIPTIVQKITDTILPDNESRYERKSETYIDKKVDYSRSQEGELAVVTERCVPTIPYLNYYPDGYNFEYKAIGRVANRILPIAFNDIYEAAQEKMGVEKGK